MNCILEVGGKEIWVRKGLVSIAHVDAEGFQYLRDPIEALNVIRGARKGVDLFTFTQCLSEPEPKYDFLLEWDNQAVLPISTFDHWMKEQIDFKVRNKVRKAAKNNVVVREVQLDDGLLRGIQQIYNETPIRQGRQFWHFGKDIEALRKMKSTFIERSIFLGAYLEDSLIGFIKLVTDDDGKQAGLMHILSMVKHRDKAPTNALMAQAVKSCAERGISYLTYANFSYGKKQGSALAEFKRNNGFEKVNVPRYFVPLTLLGSIGYRLGLHREMIEWVPEPVAAVYRKARIAWYRKRYPGFQNA